MFIHIKILFCICHNPICAVWFEYVSSVSFCICEAGDVWVIALFPFIHIPVKLFLFKAVVPYA